MFLRLAFLKVHSFLIFWLSYPLIFFYLQYLKTTNRRMRWKPTYSCEIDLLIYSIRCLFLSNHFVLILEWAEVTLLLLANIRILHHLVLNIGKVIQTPLHKGSVEFCCKNIEEHMSVFQKIHSDVFYVAP